MMSNLLILLIFFLQCISSKGMPVHSYLLHSDIDVMIHCLRRLFKSVTEMQLASMIQQFFRCTNDNSGFLTWELTPTFRSTKLVSINRFSHPEGTILRDQIGSTHIVFTVISANTTFIGTTLTILNPISLNGTRIQCNMDTLLLKITLGKLPCHSVVVGRRSKEGKYNLFVQCSQGSC